MENTKFNEGYRAYFDGIGLDDGPYKVDNQSLNWQDWEKWRDGWIQAESDSNGFQQDSADFFEEEIPFPDPESHFEEK